MSERDGAVYFYTDKHYVFDNFSAFAVEYGGVVYPTVEHAYQCAKFLPHRPLIAEVILRATSPHMAKKLAHVPAHEDHIRGDWSEVRVALMKSLLEHKVCQHWLVHRRLLETGNMVIVEDSPTDSFWGRGPDHAGQNMLGKLWMELRDELRRS